MTWEYKAVYIKDSCWWGFGSDKPDVAEGERYRSYLERRHGVHLSEGTATTGEHLEDLLDQLGAQGWEAYGADNGWFFFKRQVSPSWEYQFVYDPISTGSSGLERLGAIGWELVTATGSGHLVMRRPVQSSGPPTAGS